MKKVLFSFICFILSQVGFAQFDDVFNKNYFKIGVSLPRGEFEETSGSHAGFAKTGLTTEIGTFGYLTKKSQYAFGLNTVLGYSFNPIDYEKIPLVESSTPYHFGEFKIGPLFSFNPYDLIVLDVFVRANGIVSFGPKVTYTTVGGNAKEEDSSLALGVGFNWGFNIRYSSFLMGIEFDQDNLKYIRRANPDDIEWKQRTNTLRLVLGVTW